MSPNVLGRDPFARSEPPAPTAQPAAAPKPARARKPKPKVAVRQRRKPPTAAPARPAPPVEDTSPAPTAEPDEIDRQELLAAFGRDKSAIQHLFEVGGRLCDLSSLGRRLGEWGMRWRSEDVDPFGFDPVAWAAVRPAFEFLYERYWRIEVRGLEHVPAEGPALLVGNHSGTLPYDGIMLKLALERQHPSGRSLRFLVEDFLFYFPWIGPFTNRIGGVRACQENAERLLIAGELAAVFPEGIRGIGKLFRDRYKLQRFGRGGFVKLATRTGCPIIPVAIVGAEEIHPLLARLAWLSRALGLPYLPITPTFPWLGPLGAVPLPSKWIIEFGKPLAPPPAPQTGELDPAQAMRVAEEVRAVIQQMLNDLLVARGHAFLGPREA